MQQIAGMLRRPESPPLIRRSPVRVQVGEPKFRANETRPSSEGLFSLAVTAPSAELRRSRQQTDQPRFW